MPVAGTESCINGMGLYRPAPEELFYVLKQINNINELYKNKLLVATRQFDKHIKLDYFYILNPSIFQLFCLSLPLYKSK